jgi:hypothetical protein
MDELPVLARKAKEFGFEGMPLAGEKLVVSGGWSAV